MATGLRSDRCTMHVKTQCLAWFHKQIYAIFLFAVANLLWEKIQRVYVQVKWPGLNPVPARLVLLLNRLKPHKKCWQTSRCLCSHDHPMLRRIIPVLSGN